MSAVSQFGPGIRTCCSAFMIELLIENSTISFGVAASKNSSKVLSIRLTHAMYPEINLTTNLRAFMKWRC